MNPSDAKPDVPENSFGNPPTPTPETDAETYGTHWVSVDFARRLERERDEALAALSGRTVSCAQCNDAATKIAAMRKAIETACDSLDGLDIILPGHSGMFVLHALAQLKPFLKP
jgi:hypothetical protein